MRKKSVLVVLVLLFSMLVELIVPAMIAQAAVTEKGLVDDRFLTVSYQEQVKKDKIYWQLTLERPQNDDGLQRRVKLKILDEKDQVIEYPAVEGMEEKETWLREKDFSETQKLQVSFALPKTIEKLQLYVQLDQRAGEEGTIEEDILENEGPFLLTTSTATTESEEKTKTSKDVQATEQTTTRSEAFIGPKTKSAITDLAKTKSLGNLVGSLYTNKEPEYTTDNSGTYPTASWQPDGQTNVINHQGGNTVQAGWDGLTSWDVANDQHQNSYIKYGNDAADPNIQLRKYAQQTDKEDEFKIKLNVRGNTTYKPGVDIVFLLDNTGSMVSGGSTKKRRSVEALNTLITNLEKNASPEKNGIRVGAHIFAGYNSSTEEFWDWTREKTTHKLSSQPSDWKKIKKAYESLTAVGDTFTQRGLQEAQDLFNDPATNIGERYKLLFVLTDGAPTSSWQPATAVANSSMYYNPTLITSFNSGTAPNYSSGLSLGATGNKTLFDTALTINGQRVSSHLTTTNSTAYALKQSGIEIHSLAVQITTSSGDHPKAELLKGLYKMATKKANAITDEQKDYFFYHTDNTSELTNYLNEWYKTIIRTVNNGEVDDPLGDMVELVTDNGKEPKITQVENGAAKIEDADEPTITSTASGIKVKNLNLTSNQEVELEYTVRLKSNYVSNQWYQTNKTTTLKPAPERTEDVLEFGSPSVRLQKADFVIPVKKIWSDTYRGETDYWGLRPNAITMELQRKVGNNDWQKVEEKILNEGNQWETNFSAVEGGDSNTYRVVELKREDGYADPKVSQTEFTSNTIASDGIKVTNELLREDYQFWKFKGENRELFKGDLPKFSVKRSDGKVLAENLVPDDTGKVAIKDLPIGTFIVEETYVPVGFQKMSDFTIEVTESDPSGSLVFKIEGQSGDYNVLNLVKNFSLQIEKVGPDGLPLSGASFKLVGPENYEKTEAKGPTFNFTNLSPGNYVLTEEESPDGYERIKDPIKFEISPAGQVSISNHPNVTGQGGITENGNTIELQVTNKKVRSGALPYTGDRGLRSFLIIAGTLASLGVALSIVYLYRQRTDQGTS